MSSTYSLICMNHDPGIEIADGLGAGDIDSSALPVTLRGVRGIHHPDCDIVAARESGPIIQVACLAPMDSGHGHNGVAVPRWTDMDTIRLIFMARQVTDHPGLGAALSRHFEASRCWPQERIWRLRGVVDLEPWSAK